MSDNEKLGQLLVTEEEKNEIKKNSPEALPLNPTAQGYSGQEVRRMLGASITGKKGSVLNLIEKKMEVIKEHFETGLYGLVEVDDESTYVDIVLELGQDITFTRDLLSLIINIPEDCKHGFYGGINFKTKGDEFPIVINNDSVFPLKIIKYNLEIPSVQVSAFKTINMSFYCDGINIYCQYVEV